MILGINGIRLIGRRSGVGRCIEAVLRCLGELEHPFDEVRVYTPAPLGEDIYLPPIATNIVLPSALSPGLWEQVVLPKAHGRQHLLFCPSYVLPILARCPTVLVHHGSYEGYPQAFDWYTLNKARLAYGLSARRATVVSTVSEHSKRDMVRYYGIKPERIAVVPEGVDTQWFRPLGDPARLASWRASVFGADTPFVMYVGKPTERRNLCPLIRAFAQLKRQDTIGQKLLIVGSDQPGTSPFRQVIAEERLESDVVIRGYMTHEELVLAYNSTDLLIYPSSYEGFGMPVLEGMACGTPVIALNNTAFPEFAGGVAHLLENAAVPTLRQGILAVLCNPAWRQRMAQEGPKRAAAYDWRIVTQKYLDLMLTLVNLRTL